MTKPFSEPSIHSDQATLAHRVRQLERRPGTVGGSFEILLFAPTERPIAGDGEPLLMIPRDLSGLRLIDCAAGVPVEDFSDPVEVMVRNQSTGNDMLSTSITIDAGTRSSYFAATPPVIDPAEALVTLGQWIAWDVWDAGSDALGLVVVVVFG